MHPEKISTPPVDVREHDETQADAGAAVESVISREAPEATGPSTAAGEDDGRSDLRRAIAKESQSADDGRIDRLTNAMSGLDREDLAAMLHVRVGFDLGIYGSAAPSVVSNDLSMIFHYWRYFIDELVRLVAGLPLAAAQNRHDDMDFDHALERMQEVFEIKEDYS